MSGTTYDKTLTTEQAPHIVAQPYGSGAHLMRREWLDQNGQGSYAWTRAVFVGQGWFVNYRFTDADTAFWFKMAAP